MDHSPEFRMVKNLVLVVFFEKFRSYSQTKFKNVFIDENFNMQSKIVLMKCTVFSLFFSFVFKLMKRHC